MDSFLSYNLLFALAFFKKCEFNGIVKFRIVMKCDRQTQRQWQAQNRCGLIFSSSSEKVAILRLYFEDNMIMMLQ